jgi:hypothetical protein
VSGDDGMADRMLVAEISEDMLCRGDKTEAPEAFCLLSAMPLLRVGTPASGPLCRPDDVWMVMLLAEFSQVYGNLLYGLSSSLKKSMPPMQCWVVGTPVMHVLQHSGDNRSITALTPVLARGTGSNMDMLEASVTRSALSQEPSFATQSPRSTTWGSSPCLLQTWKSVDEMRRQSAQDCHFEAAAIGALSRADEPLSPLQEEASIALLAGGTSASTSSAAKNCSRGHNGAALPELVTAPPHPLPTPPITKYCFPSCLASLLGASVCYACPAGWEYLAGETPVSSAPLPQVPASDDAEDVSWALHVSPSRVTAISLHWRGVLSLCNHQSNPIGSDTVLSTPAAPLERMHSDDQSSLAV